MKINEPVTNKEIEFLESDILVSKTNSKGAITYVNPAFLQISGFDEDELIGKNHNVVRHPDMPPEAFADLWTEIQKGNTWTGIIKNRCKNGDFYWVKANVAAIDLGDGDVEYMSVRSVPTQEEVLNASNLYANIIAGQGKLSSTVDSLSFWSLEKVVSFGVTSIFLTTIALFSMVAAEVSSEWLYLGLSVFLAVGVAAGLMLKKHVVEPLMLGRDKLNEITKGNYFDWMNIEYSGVIGDVSQSIKATQVKIGFEMLNTQRLAESSLRSQTALDGVSTAVMMADENSTVVYMNRTVNKMFRNLESEIKTELPNFDANNVVGQSVSIFCKDSASDKLKLDEISDLHSTELNIGSLIFKIVATPVVNEDGHRLGTSIEWLDLTEERAQVGRDRELREQEAKQAREDLRIRTALDNVSSCVMLADASNNIIYMNKTVQEMFTDAEKDIQKDLPKFKSDKLLHSSIDSFHKNPAHQQRLLEALKEPLDTEIKLGGRTFSFTASPVVDTDQGRVGTVVEWIDRTLEVAVEIEIESIVSAARSGDLKARVEIQGKQGFFKSMGEGINALLDDLGYVFDDLGVTLKAMSEGNFTKPVGRAYQGAFSDIKNDLNNTLIQVSDTLSSLRGIADEVTLSSNEITSGNINLSSRTESQASSLQETASSIEELSSTVRNNAENAQQANRVSITARDVAEKGGEVVGNAVEAMSKINETSNRIAEIIGVIDEIAFQTNLLALNASVEAARAGEQGRGFAVVATEVRNLASRSADAAKEIKTHINDSLEKVEAGSKLVNESGETLAEIVTGVKKVSDIIAEIAAASSEQTAGIDQVNQAITSMDEVTQQNAALAEEISAASSSLDGKAKEMEAGIAFFNISNDATSLVADSQVG